MTTEENLERQVFLVQLGNRLKLKVKKLLNQLDLSKCDSHLILADKQSLVQEKAFF